MNTTYNINTIKETLENFYTLTGFRVALFNESFGEIYSYPSRFSNFCKIIRENDTLNNYCKKDDLKHFQQCAKSKSSILYTCHAGLYEIIVPVFSKNEIIGYLMAGQIYGDNSYLSNFDMICKHFKNFNLDIQKLSAEYNYSEKTNLTKLNATKYFMEICAEHICKASTIYKEQNSLENKIDEYILQNLKEDLNIELLCQKFNYKKTNFYKVTNKIYGITITQHIRQLRISKAKDLLINTTLKINEVANHVGIFDYNYFTKVFKNEANCTPKEFRNNNIFINK